MAQVSTIVNGDDRKYVEGLLGSWGNRPMFRALFWDRKQSELLATDLRNHCIWAIKCEGPVRFLALGGGQRATFDHPSGVVSSEGIVYVSETGQNSGVHRIQRLSSGKASVLSGNRQGFSNGQGLTSTFFGPHSLAIASDNSIYVADTGNHAIRRVTPDGRVSTVAGTGRQGFKDGRGEASEFNWPEGIACGTDGNLYVCDTYNNRIRKIGRDSQVQTVAGNGESSWMDGNATNSSFNRPRGISLDSAGRAFVADSLNYRIRVIDPDGKVSTLAGDGKDRYLDGPGLSASFFGPLSLAVASSGQVFVADSVRIRLIEL